MYISDLIEKLTNIQNRYGNIPVAFTADAPEYPKTWIDGNLMEISAHMSNDNDCHYECVFYVDREAH